MCEEKGGFWRLVLNSFSNTKDNGHDASPDQPGILRNGLPLGEFLKRGFGIVVVPQGDLVRHNEVESKRESTRCSIGPVRVFPKPAYGTASRRWRGALRGPWTIWKGLISEASPRVGEAIIDSNVGYHIRPGGHSVEMFDWLKFLEFAEHHFKKP